MISCHGSFKLRPKFYTSAEKALIDSLVSIWFRGKAKEQAYMRQILSKDEPLMAEPVFQSIFPWESSKETFGEHASKLKILSSDFVAHPTNPVE